MVTVGLTLHKTGSLRRGDKQMHSQLTDFNGKTVMKTALVTFQWVLRETIVQK
tara:strand:- start:211 stop:369 length:159 start_codon:yes stop_codon:yes gene_type:complete